MAKPTIVTRVGKGSELTWTEQDSNFTNLQDATLAIKAGSAGTSVTSDLNGEIVLVAGSNITLTGDNTAKTVTIAAAGGGGDVVTDTTPQLGGDLDVNGFAITTTALTLPVAIKSNYLKIGEASATGITWLTTAGAQNLYLGPQDISYSHILIAKNANGNISIVPDGTGKVVIDGLSWPTADGTANYVLKTDGAGNLSWVAQSSGGISDVVADTTPQLGGSLDVNGNSIVSTSNGNIVLQPDGTGAVQLNADTVRVGDVNTLVNITTNGTGSLNISTNGGTNSGIIRILQGVNGNIQLIPNGTGIILLDADIVRIGDANTAATLTTNGTGNLTISTNSGTNSGTIAITQGTNGNISLTPNGTGQTIVKNLEYQEFVHALGTTSGTIAPDAANGNVQTITLNGNLTINAFTNPVSGQSITLIITTGGTGRTLTSSMLFAGASKTLSTTSTVDILTMTYIGTTYYASLSKGFA